MKKLDFKSTAIILILVGSLIGGGIAPLAKIALNELSPELFSFLRFTIAAVFLFPFFIKKKKNKIRDLIKLIPLSLLSTINILLFAYGVRYTTADISQALYIISPIFILILAHIFLREKVGLYKLAGIIVGLTGAFLVLVLPIIENSKFSGNLMGNFLILVAVFSWSIYVVLSKRFQRKYTPMEITLGMCLTSSLTTLFLMLPNFQSNILQIQQLSNITILSVLYISIMATAILYVMFQYLVKISDATTASSSLFVQPIATIIWSYFLLGEKLTIGFIVGGMLTLLGTYLVIKAKNN